MSMLAELVEVVIGVEGVSDRLCKSCGPTLRPRGLGRSTLDVDDQRGTAVADGRR